MKSSYDYSVAIGSRTQLVLRVTHPDGSIAHSTLEAGRVLLIGSGRGAGLRLESRDVGSIHCAVSIVDEGLAIRDWGTSTGTVVNGSRVEGEIYVPRNAQIEVGPYVICVRPDQDGGDLAGSDNETQVDVDAHPLENCAQAAIAEGLTEDDRSTAEQSNDASPRFELNVDQSWSSQPDDDACWAAEFGTPSDDVEQFLDGNPFDLDESELLRREVETLQQEVAARDELIARMRSEVNESAVSTCESLDIDPGETERLLSRVEDLLEELEAGDARVAQLEELLRVSEEATAAEKEERQQLEAWVSDIETRVAAREEEWAAQREQLLEQLNAAQDVGDSRPVRHGAIAEIGIESQADTTAQASLQRRIDELEAENRRLADERESQEARVRQELAGEFAASGRSEQLEVATARAELARQRAELVRREEELEKLKARLSESEGSADQKIRAFRDHLREIKSEEDEQRRSRRLGSRLASLWQRLEGR